MKKAHLDRYRNQLLEMRDRLREEVEGLVEGLPEISRPPGDVSTVPTHNADFDSEGLDIQAMLEENQAALLGQVEDALDRLDAGTYGRCTDCGSDILKTRLDALPYTPFCTRCSEKHTPEQSPWPP